MKKNRLGIIALVAVAAMWGLGYVSCEYAYSANWSIFSILFFRCSLGFLVCLLFSLKDHVFKNKRLLLDGSICGILFFAGYGLSLYGQKNTTVSNASLLVSSGILTVPIISYLLFKKKPSKEAIIACIVGLIGSLVLSYDSNFNFKKGDIFCILGSLCFSLHFVYLDKVTPKYKTTNLISIQFLSMAFIALIGILIYDRRFVGDMFDLFNNKTNLYGFIGVLYYAIFSGIICFLLQGWSQKYVEPSKASLIVSTEGLFGSFFGIIFMNQHLDTQTIIGSIIIIIALIICNLNDIKETITELKEKRRIKNGEIGN